MQTAYGPNSTPEHRKRLERHAPVLAKVVDNRAAVIYQMKRDGFTNDDIATIMTHGIRSTDDSYNQGLWTRLSDDQATKYIDMLYEGV